MNPGFYLQTHRVEERHWWFRHRRLFASGLLQEDRTGPFERALDLGCGTGGNLPWLRRHCRHVVGLDRSELALGLARGKQAEANLVLGDANRVLDHFRESSFDLITVFNVLYHRWVVDDGEVLRQLGLLLRPGGRLLLTEPAFPVLARRHDRLDHGARRYTRARLRETVVRAGLAVRQASYFNLPSFLPALLVAALERRSRLGQRAAADRQEESRELAVPPGPVNGALLALLWPERFWLSRGRTLPFGVGVFVVADRKPGEKRERSS